MAYETTDVPVARSQEGIRKLLRAHGSITFAAISAQQPGGIAVEGFDTEVLLDGIKHRIRIMAKVPEPPPQRTRRRWRHGSYTQTQKCDLVEKMEKRVWRVLFYHLKALFEAADTGVLEFRELILPYLVTGNGKTVGEQLLAKGVDQLLTAHPARMLVAHNPEVEATLP